MGAKRTVDPTGAEHGTHFIGVRLAPTQVKQLQQLCEQNGLSKSKMIRQLIITEVERVSES